MGMNEEVFIPYCNYQDLLEEDKFEIYNDLIDKVNLLEQQLQAYKDKIDKATKYIDENSDYEEVGDDYTSNCEKIFEGDIDELLQILNENSK
jgi:hypothetical protein